MSSRNRPLDEAGLDAFDRIEQPDVGRHVDHPEPWRDEHHRDLGRPGQVSQHLRVSREPVTAGVQRLLVQGSGADGVCPPGDDQFDRPCDVSVGGVAGQRRQRAEGQVGGDQAKVHAVDTAREERRLVRIGDGPDRQRDLDDLSGPSKAAGIANHERAARLVEGRVGEALHDDLGADAGGVPHRYRNDGSVHHMSSCAASAASRRRVAASSR